MDAIRRQLLGLAAAGAIGLLPAKLSAQAAEAREAPEHQQLPYKLGKTLYENPLAGEKDIADFRLEGQAKFSFPNGRLHVEAALDPSQGQKANFVFWCPKDFPDNIAVSWQFYPLKQPGLAMFFFSAMGRNGEDLFDAKLPRRTGEYPQYMRGAINALHVSYFRRNFPKNVMQLHLTNLRKSHGFHLVAQGADPMPRAEDASPPYTIQVVKMGPQVLFSIENILSFHWTDDGQQYGPVLGGGKIGFRQMSPLVAEYANLKVEEVTSV